MGVIPIFRWIYGQCGQGLGFGPMTGLCDLSSALCAQPLQNGVDVVFDCGKAEAEFLGDLGVGKTVGDGQCDLALSACQSFGRADGILQDDNRRADFAAGLDVDGQMVAVCIQTRQRRQGLPSTITKGGDRRANIHGRFIIHSEVS